jgi:hypothetical protein
MTDTKMRAGLSLTYPSLVFFKREIKYSNFEINNP